MWIFWEGSCYDEEGKEIFNFGKYKGQRVEEVSEKRYGILWLDDERPIPPAYKKRTDGH